MHEAGRHSRKGDFGQRGRLDALGRRRSGRRRQLCLGLVGGACPRHCSGHCSSRRGRSGRHLGVVRPGACAAGGGARLIAPCFLSKAAALTLRNSGGGGGPVLLALGSICFCIYTGAWESGRSNRGWMSIRAASVVAAAAARRGGTRPKADTVSPQTLRVSPEPCCVNSPAWPAGEAMPQRLRRSRQRSACSLRCDQARESALPCGKPDNRAEVLPRKPCCSNRASALAVAGN